MKLNSACGRARENILGDAVIGLVKQLQSTRKRGGLRAGGARRPVAPPLFDGDQSSHGSNFVTRKDTTKREDASRGRCRNEEGSCRGEGAARGPSRRPPTRRPIRRLEVLRQGENARHFQLPPWNNLKLFCGRTTACRDTHLRKYFFTIAAHSFLPQNRTGSKPSLLGQPRSL